MAKVSVIVPVYNTQQYLDQCLTALTNQTLRDIEIICVDDFSTDNSLEIIRKYQQRDSRIKIIQNDQNRGLSASRNHGIKNATADYIMFCDDDDYYEPDMCQEMLDLVQRNNADMAVCSVNVIYETPELERMRHSDNKMFNIPDGCFDVNSSQISEIHNGSPLRIFKRDIITNNNLMYPVGLKYEDVYFNKVYCLYAKRIATTSKKLYNYRRRSNSLTHQVYSARANYTDHYFRIALKYFDYLNEHNLYKQNYYDFWTNLFIKATEYTFMFMHDDKDKAKINLEMTDFIKKNYRFGSTNKRTDFLLFLITRGAFGRYKRYLFGLVNTYSNTYKTEYNLCKIICLFKIKRYETYTKFYLFGIPVYKHKVA